MASQPTKILVVGGNSGIGLALVLKLLANGAEKVYIVGKQLPNIDDIPEQMQNVFVSKTIAYQMNLTDEDYTLFDTLQDIDGLIITAGFGRVALFENLNECEIKNLVKCNELSIIQILHKYYNKIKSNLFFPTAIMVSIAGHIVSPFFSVYGATKSALKMFIENINTELEAGGFENRILDCSPGAIHGTAFRGGKTDISILEPLATEILSHMFARERLFIPQYEEIYQNVLSRYHNDSREFGLSSYHYKENNGRVQTKPQVVVGYLSGTFDLFHIGHLNLLRRAKQQCDYLIVGVHESGAWKGKETYIPYEERCEILKSIRYVDRVVKSLTEDSDAWDAFHFDKLFVGDDYKGTERFQRYESYFADKGVEIVYFPYTHGTSSTQLRQAISNGLKQ